MPEHFVFLAFEADGQQYRLPLSNVQEIINLTGPFADLDTSSSTVKLRQRTVHIVDVEKRWGVRPHASALVLCEHNHKLIGLPVQAACHHASAKWCELRLDTGLPS
jgi:chemotaxis signal transduction protein